MQLCPTLVFTTRLPPFVPLFYLFYVVVSLAQLLKDVSRQCTRLLDYARDILAVKISNANRANNNKHRHMLGARAVWYFLCITSFNP